MDSMNLEFHNYEEMVTETAPMCFLVPADKIKAFTALCEARLTPTTDERQLIQTVVLAALETEQIVLKIRIFWWKRLFAIKGCTKKCWLLLNNF